MKPPSTIRLQQFLAHAGVASRRRSEELITAGKIKVNGRVVRELGTKVDPVRDRVVAKGKRVIAEEIITFVMNKPDATVTTTSDPEGRRTVLDVMGKQVVRLYPVGRLDYHTTGVLLLTNDGGLAAALMHPRNAVPRIYQVKVKGAPNNDQLAKLRAGVRLAGVGIVTADVARLRTTATHCWISMTLRQGANRQIHRMLEAIGSDVLRLKRVSFAGITADRLRPGEYRELNPRELAQLRKLVGTKVKN